MKKKVKLKRKKLNFSTDGRNEMFKGEMFKAPQSTEIVRLQKTPNLESQRPGRSR